MGLNRAYPKDPSVLKKVCVLNSVSVLNFLASAELVRSRFLNYHIKCTCSTAQGHVISVSKP